MITELQREQLDLLVAAFDDVASLIPQKYKKILTNAIETWERDGITPGYLAFGVQSQFKQTSQGGLISVYKIRSVNSGLYNRCCLLGGALIDKEATPFPEDDEYSPGGDDLYTDLYEYFRLSQDEVYFIIQSFDGHEVKPKFSGNFEEKAAEFGLKVRKALLVSPENFSKR